MMLLAMIAADADCLRYADAAGCCAFAHAAALLSRYAAAAAAPPLILLLHFRRFSLFSPRHATIFADMPLIAMS